MSFCCHSATPRRNGAKNQHAKSIHKATRDTNSDTLCQVKFSNTISYILSQLSLSNIQISPTQVADCVAKVLSTTKIVTHTALKALINKTKASFHTPLTPK
jgi:hypothetical protein